MIQNVVADPGRVFVCMDCGRRSQDRMGKHALTSGWSRSCSSKAAQFSSKDLVLNNQGLVCSIKKRAITRRLRVASN